MSTQVITPQTLAENIDRLFALFETTNKQMQETDRKIRSLEGMFGNQWGKLIEALVRPGVSRIFKERGVDVEIKSENTERTRDGEQMELDIVLESDPEANPNEKAVAVIVEVKSTLSVDDVNEFLDDLSRVHLFFPRFKQMRVFGAVAGLDIQDNAGRYAYKRGLFVLAVGGDQTVTMLNDDKFRPRDFRS